MVSSGPAKTPQRKVVAHVPITRAIVEAGVSFELAHVWPAERTEPRSHVRGLHAIPSMSGVQRIGVHMQLSVFHVYARALLRVLELETVAMEGSCSHGRSECESFVINLRGERIICYRDSDLPRLQLAYNDILRVII